MATLFVSDLHLPDEPSPLRAGFLHFLRGPARSADAVYLLGDVFEYWIGDDVGLRRYAPEAEALRALTAAGVPVWFMHGNRDFLVGRRFTCATGVQLLRDPTCVELAGEPVLLSHGDCWCIDDRAYQRWRRFARNPLAQRLFLRLPAPLRECIAGGVRGRSASAKRNKAEAIMDVNAAAVAAAFCVHHTACIVHGHTHRPAEHRIELGGVQAQRIVLADWRAQHMEYLSAGAGGFTRVRIAAGQILPGAPAYHHTAGNSPPFDRRS